MEIIRRKPPCNSSGPICVCQRTLKLINKDMCVLGVVIVLDMWFLQQRHCIADNVWEVHSIIGSKLPACNAHTRICIAGFAKSGHSWWYIMDTWKRCWDDTNGFPDLSYSQHFPSHGLYTTFCLPMKQEGLSTKHQAQEWLEKKMEKGPRMRWNKEQNGEKHSLHNLAVLGKRGNAQVEAEACKVH